MKVRHPRYLQFRALIIAGATLCLGGFDPSALAQAPGSSWNGVAAVGTAIPTAAISQHSTAGIGGILGVERWDSTGTTGIRAEALGTIFRTGSYSHACDASGCDTPMVAVAMLDLVIRGAPSPSAQSAPGGYFIGGIGLGRTTGLAPVVTPAPFNVYSPMTTTGVAWNVGLGMRFPTSSGAWFLEARYLSVAGPSGRGGAWPLSIGMEF